MTGTEGSIPPATAIDEDQIEIVNVILNTYEVYRDEDGNPDPTLIPSHDDLTQLWRCLMALFAQRYITRHIFKRVHGADADFPDLHEAFKWLGRYIITQTGYVTFLVAPGKWTYTATVELDHQNMSRVAIQGSALLGASPQNNNLSVTGYYSATDGSNQAIYLRSIYATELSFTGGVTGFRSFSMGCVLRYLLLTGSQTIGPPPSPPGGGWPWASSVEGVAIDAFADVSIDGVSMWGFGNFGINVNSCNIRMASNLSMVISYCNHGGIGATGAQFIAESWSNVIIVSNGGIAILINGGYFWFHNLYMRGNRTSLDQGILNVRQGGMVACQLCVATVNHADAILLTGVSWFFAVASNFSNNAGGGFSAYGSNVAFFHNSTITGNGGPAIWATGFNYIETIGSTIIGPVHNVLGHIVF